YQATAPAPVGGWDKLDFWQRSDSGRVNGIAGNVDLNLFNGTDGQLDLFALGNLEAAGGKLDGLHINNGPDLGANSTVLIGAILAVAAGALAVPALAEVASQADVDGITSVVTDLIANNNLPIEQLETMAQGNYSLGDLVILLDNAQHVQ
ncbi:MAG: hydrolase, partial [Corynebacterium sp.]|nr:hydrolase [Corynebacterium sp.]